MSLIDPQPVPADGEVRHVARTFASSDSRRRAELRDDLSMNDFYALLTFAQRASVFAMRSNDPAWVIEALHAVAIVDAGRIDERDIPLTLSIVHHAAERIGMDTRKHFESAASLAEKRPAELFRSFVRGEEKYKDIRSSWGHDEIVTSHGIGIITREFSPYKPSRDMAALAVKVAMLTRGDQYVPASVAIASKLPPIWFRTHDETGLLGLLRHVRAGFTVQAMLLPTLRPVHEMQTLFVFVVETEEAGTADQLLRITATHPPREETRIAVREGELFCMLIQHAVWDEAAPYENAETLARFREPISALLKEY